MSESQVRRFAYILFGVGIALLGEHIIVHNGTEWDILGHETFGLLAIIISFVLLLKPKKNVKSEDNY